MNETTTVKRESDLKVVGSGFSLQRIVKAEQKSCGQLEYKEFFNWIYSSSKKLSKSSSSPWFSPNLINFWFSFFRSQSQVGLHEGFWAHQNFVAVVLPLRLPLRLLWILKCCSVTLIAPTSWKQSTLTFCKALEFKS